ncbi:MAG: T9SS type A sorting domain-containing protein, partial [Phaeodactylibacter sp.]|nr:T9SS type A sorting domain-containing protein [Phaeodactylibacter sp.]
FLIFPEATKTFHGIWEIDEAISLLGIAPHMHLLGQDWTVLAVHPDGDTTQLIRIPDWDFNWQGSYYFDHFISLEPGTEIHAYATYDNTSNNPLNPNNPPQLMTWGEKTTDEMYYLPLLFVPYQPGDESIVFEEPTSVDQLPAGIQVSVNHLEPVVPNPATDAVSVRFSLAKGAPITIRILDISGQVVATPVAHRFYGMGKHQLALDALNLEGGLYFLQLSGAQFQMTTRFSVLR